MLTNNLPEDYGFFIAAMKILITGGVTSAGKGMVHEYKRFRNERLDQFEQYFKNQQLKEKQNKKIN